MRTPIRFSKKTQRMRKQSERRTGDTMTASVSDDHVDAVDLRLLLNEIIKNFGAERRHMRKDRTKLLRLFRDFARYELTRKDSRHLSGGMDN